MSNDVYEAYAVRYARVERDGRENFIDGDPHDGPMPLNYYVWVVRNAARTVIIDTGFDERGAKLRNRSIIKPVAEGLEALGIDRNAVTDVIVTHMHYDHAGNDGMLPNAQFHLQGAEIAYATGRCMCHRQLSHAYEVEDVVTMVRRVFAGRVCFHEGEAELFPGLSLHHIGGHSRGLQAVRVKTARGHVVIASDVAHHYAHLQQRRVFPVVDSVSDVLEGYRKVEALASSCEHIVPGHDPLVAEIYPPHSKAMGEWIVRLDQEPDAMPERHMVAESDE